VQLLKWFWRADFALKKAGQMYRNRTKTEQKNAHSSGEKTNYGPLFWGNVGFFTENDGSSVSKVNWHDYCTIRMTRSKCAPLLKVCRGRFIWERHMSKTGIIDLLESGMRAETLKQQAISNNVANLQTPGYRRLGVKFEQLLAKAIESGDAGKVDLDAIKAELYQPKNTAVSSNGNDVNLEVEVGDMVKNSIRYRAFIKLLSKKYAQIDDAINIK
jgi:flagellar basal-body rod protein FlgB